MSTTENVHSAFIRRSVRGVAAASVLLSSTAGALAADVTVTRVLEQVFVHGGDDDDRIVLSSAEPGLLTIAAADGGTTVDGGAAVELRLRPRDAVYLLLGDGENSVDVEGLPRVRRFVTIGGADADTLTIRGADVRSSLLFLGQGGADRLEFTAASRVTGDVLAAFGDGSDTFQATQAEFSRELVVDLGGGDVNAAHLDATTAGSSVIVLGGAGDDEVAISGGSVRRLAQIDLGGGDDTLLVGAGARFEGSFSFRGGDDRDSVTVIGDASFRGSAVFALGRGDDHATFGLAQYERGLRVSAGDGDDALSLSEFAAGGYLLVQCGLDDDTVTLDDTRPFDLGPVGGRVDGGAGTDTLSGGITSGASYVRFEVKD